VHNSHALHRIEVWSLLCLELFSDFLLKKWNGDFFEKSSLRDAGLRIQLGHGGGKCIAPTPGPITFIVVDVSGIYNVTIHNDHSLSLMAQASTMWRSTSAIVAQMVSFLITSKFFVLVGSLPPSFALKQPSHFTVSISTMN
jgi:CxC2 like cysteine cluster associated with KDZ transposases